MVTMTIKVTFQNGKMAHCSVLQVRAVSLSDKKYYGKYQQFLHANVFTNITKTSRPAPVRVSQ